MLTVDFGRLAMGAGSRVLDIGCGNGRHAFEALRAGAHVTAIDLDGAALAEVRRLASAMAEESHATAGRLDIVSADARSLPFDEGTFDVAIAAEVLEHIEQDDRAVAELCRVLRPGGVLAVTVPRWWPEKVCWALSSEYHDNPGGHVRIYRRSELVHRLQRAGLVIIPPHHHAHALHVPYWWLRCVVGVSRERSLPVRLYHRFLVHDLMKRPRWSRALERALNPVLGKSVVVYARRPNVLAAVPSS